jgi:hypothetical protein
MKKQSQINTKKKKKIENFIEQENYRTSKTERVVDC